MALKPHICFVALGAWPIISGDRSIKTVGGAEVQQSYIARGLVDAGYRVSMICMDHGQSDGVIIDGLQVFKAHTPLGGVPVLRFLHPRLTTVWGAMRRANADVYYQRGAGVHTAYVAAFCRHHGRRFIYAAAHDADFDPGLPYITYARDRALFRWGLSRANRVVVQSPAQLDASRQWPALPSTLVKSCYAPPSPRNHRGSNGYILWAATLRKWKRPEWFIDLARRLPDLHFRMVGGGDDPDYERELRAMAVKVSNLEFRGFIPYADIDQEFDGAWLFVNTSQHEGFPNTYLQAWARGIPTVGTVVTGSTYDGGPVEIHAQSLEELADLIARFAQDQPALSSLGRRCRAAFEADHSLVAVTRRYAGIIDSLVLEGTRRV
ncbi:MAG: glycosyltransferase family 4 protein [Acidiferrobacteraceae bacterium]